MRRVSSAALLLAALVSTVAVGQAFAQGPPIHTDTPIMLGLAGRGVRSFVKVNRRGRMVDNGKQVDNPDERQLTVVQFPIVVPYNLFGIRVLLF